MNVSVEIIYDMTVILRNFCLLCGTGRPAEMFISALYKVLDDLA